ncbi:MAG: 2-C-methyl-D-erythritol 4-phosphate cytidylyltransferase [Planctomycetes bacterium]|nr:2-C-methyl-D-erythritol 4-phosphate cytidylyltransferase [Planctomycetota bacterium]
MRISAILLAAGEGRRMRLRRPKALLPLDGRPLLLHSVETFASVREVGEIVLVLPPRRAAQIRRALAPRLAPFGIVKATAGGKRRQDSVRRGLEMSDPKADVILVHDCARPFVDARIIRRVARAAYRHGAALAALPARETVKRVDAARRVLETPDRRTLWNAQTPQGFRRCVLVAAYAGGHGRADATDDAQIVERTGKPVRVVPGDPANVKITSREDLAAAEYMIRRRRAARKTNHER